MNKLKFIIKNFFNKNRHFIHILSLILIPVLITSSLLVGMFFYNISKIINDRQNHAINFLASTATACENSIEDLTEMTSSFAANPEILSLMTKTSPKYGANTKEMLNTITNSLPYVHSAFIYNDNIGIVYSDMGQFDENTFFGTYFKYESYSPTSWKNIFFYRSDPYRIMSPSRLLSDGTDTSPGVIPVVFRRINRIQLENYLILNIDLKELFSAFNDDITDVYIYNKQTEEIFSARNLSSNNMTLHKELIQLLRYNPNNTFKFKLDTGNALISTYSSNDSLLGYTYFAIIPTTEIIKQELPTIYTYLIVILISLSIAYIALRSSKKIYAPIRHVKSVLSEHSSIQTSEKENIFDQLIVLADDIKRSEDNSSHMISFAQEKYLVNLLNSTDYYIDDALNDILHSSFKFPHNHFTVVLIQLSPTLHFYELYNSEDYLNIKKGFYSVVKDLFQEHFITYVLPAENDVLDIILNFESEEDYQRITDIFKNIYSLLTKDIEYINLSVGQSGICSDLAGLKNCHDEARDRFIVYDEVRIEAKLSSLRQEAILFDRNSEDELFIVLSSYDKKKIMEVIDNLKNKNNLLSPQSMKLLYNYIINTILKFIRINNIPFKENLIDFEITNDILKQPLVQISSDIEVMIDTIVYSHSTKTNKNDIHENVIKYIQDNFSYSEISITLLSNLFSLSDSQLSRIIISHTGLGFRDYINTKRIEKAKKLLAATEKSIESVYEECGFTNPQTFRRVFKSCVGQTPSEYRQKHQ